MEARQKKDNAPSSRIRKPLPNFRLDGDASRFDGDWNDGAAKRRDVGMSSGSFSPVGFSRVMNRGCAAQNGKLNYPERPSLHKATPVLQAPLIEDAERTDDVRDACPLRSARRGEARKRKERVNVNDIIFAGVS